MCSKNSSIRPRKAKAPPKPARKSRTKTRKPKYLSLKLQLSSHHHQNRTQQNKTHQKPTNHMPHKQQQQLINLFPLHPESIVQDHKDNVQEQHDDQVSDHVAFLFETAADDTSTSLHGILDSTTTTTTTTTCTTTTTTTTSDEGSPLSPSLTYVYRGHESHHEHQEQEGSLVKTAMKCKERDASEERWVSYWEVVEKKEQEEVSSNCCYAAADALEKMVLQSLGGDDRNKMMGLVGLKLDHQQILNAWSDKGPLYIKEESPQTVPDLLDASNGQASMEGWGNLWAVPEMGSNGNMKMKEKDGEKEEWRLGQREASVLRYKEKRQSRLFSKRIRYEVRKLNAEKRPRLKGRFVKRNGEE